MKPTVRTLQLELMTRTVEPNEAICHYWNEVRQTLTLEKEGLS